MLDDSRPGHDVGAMQEIVLQASKLTGLAIMVEAASSENHDVLVSALTRTAASFPLFVNVNCFRHMPSRYAGA